MQDDSHRNEVHLLGRLPAPPVVREMPSGDSRVTWRLVVRRAGESAGPIVDTVDCGTWTQVVKQEALAWREGDHVEVWGSLRRRFWRSGGSVLSRYEVEVSTARRSGIPPARVLTPSHQRGVALSPASPRDESS